MDGHWREARPDAFHVLVPDDIPAATQFFTIPAAVRATFTADLDLGAGARSNVRIAAALEERLLRFAIGSTEESSHRMERNDADHDAYFGVARICGPNAFIYVHMLVRARVLLMREAEEALVTIGTAHLASIDRALHDALTAALGVPASHEIQVLRWRGAATRCDAMRRWVRGHQIFCALTQGLILALRTFRTASADDDMPAANRAFDVAVSLMRGSAAALLLTGDFPPEDYRNLIRPSMMPPYLPESFSGLLSMDHRRFIQTLRECGPALDALRVQDPQRHARLAAATAAVYDKHRFVCDRFVSSGASLRMAPDSHGSAGEQIEKFKHIRLKVFQAKAAAAPFGHANLPEPPVEEPGGRGRGRSETTRSIL